MTESDLGRRPTLKQIDRLVIKEIIGPWLFGVAMFSSLLMAATYLNRIAEYVVRGVSPTLILKVSLLLMPAILSKTFAMAVLLAALLAFGRLSSDSEVTAMKAAGASLMRIVRPVMLFSTIVAIVTFIFNDQVAPPAEAEAIALGKSIESSKLGKTGDPVSLPITDGGKLQAQVVAESLDLVRGTLEEPTIIVYDSVGKPTFYMHCHEMEYKRLDNGADKWHMLGGGTITPANGDNVIKVDEMWPANIPEIGASPQDFMTLTNNDLDAYSMAETKRQIERGQRDGSLTTAKIHNLEFGYWNKISVALAAFIFGTLGAVLGIRTQRTSAASGFALAVGIIFGYFTLVNFMNVWALNGILPAWAASFAPILIGLVCSGVIMWRRNS